MTTFYKLGFPANDIINLRNASSLGCRAHKYPYTNFSWFARKRATRRILLFKLIEVKFAKIFLNLAVIQITMGSSCKIAESLPENNLVNALKAASS